jgi:hypothetical protein
MDGTVDVSLSDIVGRGSCAFDLGKALPLSA